MSLYKLISDLDLNRMYSYVIGNNKSKFLPYHNNRHLERVMYYAAKIGYWEGLKESEIKELIIAAGFHDMNYIKFGNDDLNIESSINSYKKYCNVYNKDYNNNIIDLIKTTRYPYIVESKDLTLSQRIIREVDTLQALYETNYINSIIFALAEEMEISFEQMLKGQNNYLDSIKYTVPSVIMLFEQQLPILKEIINKMINIFN